MMLYDTCMNSMSSMSRLKLILAALAVVLVVIVVWQNRAAVETRILFITISMPRALLLLVTLMIGFAAGLVSAGAMRRRK